MGVNSITREQVRQLAALDAGEPAVISIFFNLDPSQFATPPARATEITSVLRRAEAKIEALASDGKHRARLKQDLEQIEKVLRGSGLAQDGTRGVAVYACSALDLFTVLELPHPTESEVAVDRRPRIEALVEDLAIDRWAVVLTSRRSARIFIGNGHHWNETDRIDDEVHGQHDQGGWSQARFQRSVEKEALDHIGHVAEVLFEKHKRRPIERVLLGGPNELLGELESRLHSYLKDIVVGRISLDVENASLSDVAEKARPLIDQYQSDRERELLDRLAEGIGTGSRSAAGLEEVVQAVNEARVDCLLLDPSLKATGCIDPQTGWLSTTNNSGKQTGELEPIEDLVERMIEQTIATDGTVVRVHHFDDLGPFGGVGAILRF